MHGRKVIVTGAGGFIGSHLCERLVHDGASVRAMCRYTSRREIGNLADVPADVLNKIEIVFGDLLDPDFVGEAVSGREAVFHLGASISVPYSFVAPREVVRTNVEGTLNVLVAARDAGVSRLVHVSSSEVYGTAQYTPIDEAHPLGVQSPYAAGKVGADKLVESFHLSFGLPAVIARPFNTYGPRQSLRAVIPTIVSQALTGPRINLGVTSPTRDFVFVADTADALVRLAATSDFAGETFNIATGRDSSVADVVAAVSELLGSELKITFQEERARPGSSEVLQLLGDAGKLRAAVGWEPSTSLREGLQAVIHWMAGRTARLTTDAYVV